MEEFWNKHKNKIILIMYGIITLVIMIFHESWKDEAQAWLIAKNLNFFELLDQMKYEGHPYLWYLILMPFAKLRFSIFYYKNNKLDFLCSSGLAVT